MAWLVSSLLSLAIIGQLSPSETRYATSTDGTRVAYDVVGSGPAVLLLHGAGQTRRVWHEIGYVARLAKEFTVISVDIRGNGESDAPGSAGAYHVDRIKEDILAVADAAKVTHFVLWGFSYGANVGRHLAASSDRVNAMVHIGIAFGEAIDPAFRQRIIDRNPRPAWLTALLDYPSIEPRDMRSPTLWVVGTKNSNAMDSLKKYESRLASTHVTFTLLEGLTHPQELEAIDVALPRELAFTREHAR